jgi:hypothetical protein
MGGTKQISPYPLQLVPDRGKPNCERLLLPAGRWAALGPRPPAASKAVHSPSSNLDYSA